MKKTPSITPKNAAILLMGLLMCGLLSTSLFASENAAPSRGMLTQSNTADIQSDDFYPETRVNAFWRFLDPWALTGQGGETLAQSTLAANGSNLVIEMSGGYDHSLGTKNRAPRLLQQVRNTNFAVEVKYESLPHLAGQQQGIIIQQDADTFIQFGMGYGAGTPRIDILYVDGLNDTAIASFEVDQHAPYLRAERNQNDWTYSYSTDGETWAIAANTNQQILVTEVGVYGASTGAPFVLSVDYFMNLEDPLVDVDVPPENSLNIELWYGDEQSFGHLGNPQQWVNVLGQVITNNTIETLSYTLNGGSDVPLPIGPNDTRLVDYGDFNVEIEYTALQPGSNEIVITATDFFGTVATKTMTLNYEADKVWTLPYAIDWRQVTNISDVAQIVDGQWELDTDGLHITAPGYDRLIVIGDVSWYTDYEVTVTFTINQAQHRSAVGIAIGWQGHEGTDVPRTAWPSQSIIWLDSTDGHFFSQILLFEGGTQAEQDMPGVRVGGTYVLKARSEWLVEDKTWVDLKIWPLGSPEPAEWQLSAPVTTRDGSVLLIAHRIDVTFQDIQIEPLEISGTP